MTPHRPSCRGGIAPNLELASNQTAHSLIALDDHYQIALFRTDLSTPTAAGEGKERRRPPTACCAARGNASAILSAENEAAFQEVRHHRNALCMFQNFFRNAPIRRGHDLV